MQAVKGRWSSGHGTAESNLLERGSSVGEHGATIQIYMVYGTSNELVTGGCGLYIHTYGLKVYVFPRFITTIARVYNYSTTTPIVTGANLYISNLGRLPLVMTFTVCELERSTMRF